MNLSENIKSIREEKRISQSELAKRLGVEPTNYPRLEKRGNSLTYEYIQLFAKALEVSVAELLNINNSPAENKEIEILKIEIDNLKNNLESANHRVRDFEVRASMYDKIEEYYLEALEIDLNDLDRTYQEYSELLNSIENQKDKLNSQYFVLFSQTRNWYEMAINELSVLRDRKLIFAWKRYNYINALHITAGEFQDMLGRKYHESMSSEESSYLEIHLLKIKRLKY